MTETKPPTLLQTLAQACPQQSAGLRPATCAASPQTLRPGPQPAALAVSGCLRSGPRWTGCMRTRGPGMHLAAWELATAPAAQSIWLLQPPVAELLRQSSSSHPSRLASLPCNSCLSSLGLSRLLGGCSPAQAHTQSRLRVCAGWLAPQDWLRWSLSLGWPAPQVSAWPATAADTGPVSAQVVDRHPGTLQARRGKVDNSARLRMCITPGCLLPEVPHTWQPALQPLRHPATALKGTGRPRHWSEILAPCRCNSTAETPQTGQDAHT